MTIFFRIPSEVRACGAEVDPAERKKKGGDGDESMTNTNRSFRSSRRMSVSQSPTKRSSVMGGFGALATPGMMNFGGFAGQAAAAGGTSKGVKFAPEVKAGRGVGTGYERRVVFEIKCEATEENHAIKLLIN